MARSEGTRRQPSRNTRVSVARSRRIVGVCDKYSTNVWIRVRTRLSMRLTTEGVNLEVCVTDGAQSRLFDAAISLDQIFVVHRAWAPSVYWRAQDLISGTWSSGRCLYSRMASRAVRAPRLVVLPMRRTAPLLSTRFTSALRSVAGRGCWHSSATNQDAQSDVQRFPCQVRRSRSQRMAHPADLGQSGREFSIAKVKRDRVPVQPSHSRRGAEKLFEMQRHLQFAIIPCYVRADAAFSRSVARTRVEKSMSC